MSSGLTENIKKVFHTIGVNLFLILFSVIGAAGGLALGYFYGFVGVFVIALASGLGFFGHLIDSKRSERIF